MQEKVRAAIEQYIHKILENQGKCTLPSEVGFRFDKGLATVFVVEGEGEEAEEKTYAFRVHVESVWRISLPPPARCGRGKGFFGATHVPNAKLALP